AVIDERGIFWDQAVAQVHDFAVHGERLDLPVREVEDRAAGRLINAARFHADKTVLDEIDAPDAVPAAELVQHAHNFERGKPGVMAAIVFDDIDAELVEERIALVIANGDADAFFKD